MKSTRSRRSASTLARIAAGAVAVVVLGYVARSGAAPVPHEAPIPITTITKDTLSQIPNGTGDLSSLTQHMGYSNDGTLHDLDSEYVRGDGASRWVREKLGDSNGVRGMTFEGANPITLGLPGPGDGFGPITLGDQPLTTKDIDKLPVLTAPPGTGFPGYGHGFLVCPGTKSCTNFPMLPVSGRASISLDIIRGKMGSILAPGTTSTGWYIDVSGVRSPMSADYLNVIVPSTVGSYIPFTIEDQAGATELYGGIPAIPAGWLKPDKFTEPYTPRSFYIPESGQAGKPITLFGPFSGDSGMTHIVFNGDPVPTYLESNYYLNFKLPLDIAGTTNLHVDDGSFHYKNPFSTIGLKLINDGKVLQPGEKDAFRVRVSGLDGIKTPVEVNIIDLEPGIVWMNNGAAQTFTIPPGSGDVVTRDYGLVGVHKGAADIVAWIPQVWIDKPIDGGGPKVADSTSTTETTGGTVSTTGTTVSTGQTTGTTTDTTGSTSGGTTTGSSTGATTTGASTGSTTGQTTGQTTGNTTGDTTGTTHKDDSQPGVAERGWFEPVQGVWQDDEKFADKPTKQITQITPTYLNAELAMILNRPTRLYGLKGDKHTYIEIKGKTNRTVEVPVRFRFTLIEGNLPPRVLYIQPGSTNTLFIEGARGPLKDFDAKLFAFDGIGKTDGTSFTFNQAGPYKIVADLIKPDGSSTGIQVTVAGNTLTTQPPMVVFQPLLLEDKADPTGRDILGAEAVRLKNEAKRIAGESVDYIPKIFPLEPGNLHVDPRPAKDFRTEVADSKSSWHLNPFTTKEQDLFNDLAAKITARYGQMVTVEKNSRIVIVVSKNAFKMLSPGKNAVAFAESHKVIFAPDTTTADTIAHELCHTLPWPWADEEMVDEFGFDYHDEFDQNYADGAEIHTGDYEKRWIHAHATMGNAFPIDTQWITQGTYWHLIKQLTEKVDPPVVCISAEIADDQHGHQDAIISPLYDQMGTVDLAEGAGDWEIRLVDASGKVQHSYAFDPVWTLPDTKTRDTFRGINECVPYLAGTAEIDIVGPGGKVLDSRKISKHAPEVSIVSPADGGQAIVNNGKLTVKWTGKDPDGGSLLYTVLYSPNNGEDWHTKEFETTSTTLDIDVDHDATQPRVKVIATNGSRSSEAQVGFVAP